MASSHGNMQSEPVKMEQKMITEFFAKTRQIILESRCPHVSSRNYSGEQMISSPSSSAPPSPSIRTRGKWFNLDLRDCPAALENIDFLRQICLEPMVVDIILLQGRSALNLMSSSPRRSIVRNLSAKEQFSDIWNSGLDEFGSEVKTGKIVERWVVQYECGKNGRDCASGSKRSTGNSMPTSYKKLILLLRLLYSMIRLLPVYKLFRDLNSTGQILTFNLTHRVSSFVEPFTCQEESEMQKFVFMPVETFSGRLCLSVFYCSSLSDVNSQPSTPITPEFIQDYVGSPMACPLKRFPSIPQGSPSFSPLGRRHSWSHDICLAASPSPTYSDSHFESTPMELILLPSPVTVVPSILIFLLFLYYLRRKNTVTNKKFPPEAGGAWPLIGHVHLLAGRKVPGKVLGALADKHGPIFTVRLGVCPALVVSKSEIVKECFSALNDKAFSDRPKFIAIELLSYNYADLSVSPHGPYWRKMRKIVMLELLSNRRLALFSHVRESEVKISGKEVYEKWMKEGRCLVEMKRWFEDITLKITLRTIAGNGKPDVKGYGEAFKDFFKLIAGFTIGDAIPFLRWLDLGGYEKEAKRTGKKIDEMFQGWLNEHKRRKNSGESAEAVKDFMDVMLEILDGGTKEELNFDADTIIKATCQGLTVGGIASTATTLTWAIALLLNNPHTLKKAQEELDTQIGGQRQVKESDIKYLVYIQAIIKETMRLYPPTHLVPSRVNIEDCTVGGYHVPAGTLLFVNLWKIHRDPEVWPNPWEFRPERFLTTHKDFDFMGKHFEFLPFGGGKRGCPGISFALQVMQLTLASLLHAFEIATPANELVDMTGGFGFSNSKMMPLEVLLTPRLPFEVYGG